MKKNLHKLILISWHSSAQKGQVSGKVLNEEGMPLPGVTVQEKFISNGTLTDFYGVFSLTIRDNKEPILVFSFLGYKHLEISIGTDKHIDVIFLEDRVGLEEVVVVGYGTQKKVNLTGAVSTISDENIANRPVGEASAGLQRLALGVTVRRTSGKPGGDQGEIRIRGIGTLSSSNPLVVIDGVEGSLNDIDPNSIENISVLKDAASSSIYGSRAANGVILVTTKRSKGAGLSIKGYIGWQKATKLPDMVDAIDPMRLTDVAYVNTGRDPLFSNELIQNYITDGGNIYLYPNTDWQKEALTVRPYE